MLVTRKDLIEAGCKQNQSWFDRRLTGKSYKLIDGKLWIMYDLNEIKIQIDNYLNRLKKLPHVQRHNSQGKCKDVLNAINSIINNSSLVGSGSSPS